MLFETLGTETCLSLENGASEKRFSGNGNNGAADYKVWRRCARTAIFVRKSAGISAEALGPWLHTLLGGEVALALEAFEIHDLSQKKRRRAGVWGARPKVPAAGWMGEAGEERDD